MHLGRWWWAFVVRDGTEYADTRHRVRQEGMDTVTGADSNGRTPTNASPEPLEASYKPPSRPADNGIELSADVTKMPATVFALAFTIFSFTTSEFAVAGLMPSLAATFDVTLARIGYLISIYALGMVFGGPMLAIGLSRLRPRRILTILCAIFLAAQVASTLAPTYWALFVFRFVSGATASAAFGAALTIGAQVVRPGQRGRAAAVILGGLTIGTVIGLPVSTALGSIGGWRMAFWAITAMSLVALTLVAIVVRQRVDREVITLRLELQSLRVPKLWSAYATSALSTGAVFAVFSYFVPILATQARFSGRMIPVLLLLYGAATVVGTIIVGRRADRSPITVVAAGILVLCGAVVGLRAVGTSGIGVAFCVMLIGLTGVSLNPAFAVRVMRVGGPSVLVNTVHSSVINIGILGGTWLSSKRLEASGQLSAVYVVSEALAVLAFASVIPFIVVAWRNVGPYAEP